MVRNEQFVFHAIASVADYVDEIIVTDTGSTDDTTTLIEKAINIYGKKIKFNQVFLEDAHKWVASDLDNTVNWDVAKLIGDIRREQHNRSTNKYILILDGDEVYPENLISLIKEISDKDFDALFVPFLDLRIEDNKFLINQIHHMGRLFNRDRVEVTGNYPCEMHQLKNSNKDLSLGDKNTLSINLGFKYKCFHFESVVKPWRKQKRNLGRINFLPEVFKKYPIDWSKYGIT